jgi:2-polyprenyl-3-methyl-5-hydroxy-6-metoxy-1,4-benzoquinol methylase
MSFNPKEHVDAQLIMGRIRDRIARRKAPEKNPGAPSPTPDSLSARLSSLENAGDIRNGEYVISSHRKVLGPVLKKGRAMVNGEVRRYVDPSIERQVSFNRQVVDSLKATCDHFDLDLRQQNISLNSTIHDLLNTLDTGDIDYVKFEDHFRGRTDELSLRQSSFLQFFKSCTNVLDIGCGRGEFVRLLEQSGIKATGIDMDARMVEHCQTQGLDVIMCDAQTYLNKVPAGELDGIFMDQVIEHLTPHQTVDILKLCKEKLKPGSFLFVETVNPLSFTSSANFDIDLSHKRRIHPESLKYLLQATGFSDIEVHFTSAVPPETALEKLPSSPGQDESTVRFVDTYNRNIDKLNWVLFGPQDYFIVCKS